MFRKCSVQKTFSHLETLVDKLDAEKVEFHLMDGLSCNFASPHNVKNTVLI